MELGPGAAPEMQLEGQLRAAGPEEGPSSPSSQTIHLPHPLPPVRYQAGGEAVGCLLQGPSREPMH